MVQVAVIDDEEYERQLLTSCFSRLSNDLKEDIQTTEYMSGEEFLQKSNYSFDLICLDIDMPGTNGMETASRIRQTNEDVLIIFITNMGHMAVRGYEVQATDFIVKPVDYPAFCIKMTRAVNLLRKRKPGVLVIPQTNGFIKLSTNEIYYIEVRGHFLWIHTAHGEIQMKSSMKEMENRLSGYPFSRCHQAFLINLGQVYAIDGDEITVGSDKIHISRAKRKEFKLALTNYLGGIQL